MTERTIKPCTTLYVFKFCILHWRYHPSPSFPAFVHASLGIEFSTFLLRGRAVCGQGELSIDNQQQQPVKQLLCVCSIASNRQSKARYELKKPVVELLWLGVRPPDRGRAVGGGGGNDKAVV